MVSRGRYDDVVKLPLITSSAHKHHIHDDDILHAFDNPIFADDLDEGLAMFIGPDRVGNLLEIGVIDSAEGPIVIHAMTARAKYLR